MFFISLYFDKYLVILLVVAIIYLFFRVNKLSLIIFLGLIIISHIPHNYNRVSTAKIVKINAKSYIAQTYHYNILVITKKKLNFGDQISFNEKLLDHMTITDDLFGFDDENYYRSYNIKYKLITDDLMVKEHFDLKKIIYNKIINKNNYYKYFIFNIKDQNIDDDLLYESGLGYYGLLFVVNKVLRIFLNEHKTKRYSILFLALIAIFDNSYGLFRLITYRLISLFIKDYKLSFAVANIILMLLLPYKVFSLSFILPFILGLVSIFRNKIFNKWLIVTLFSSLFFYQVNIIKIIFFQFHQSLKGLMYFLSFILIDHEGIYGWLIKYYRIFNHYLDLFIIRGNIGGLGIVVFIIITLIFKKFKFYQSSILIIMIIFLNIGNLYPSISIINSGKNQSILIKDHFNSRTVLIDNSNIYNYERLKRFMYAKGVNKIDQLIIKSNNQNNLHRLYNDFKIDKITDNHSFDYRYLVVNNLNIFIINNKNTLKDLLQNYNLKIDILVDINDKYDQYYEEVIKTLDPKIIISPKQQELFEEYTIKKYATKNHNIEFIFSKFHNIIKLNDGNFVIINP